MLNLVRQRVNNHTIKYGQPSLKRWLNTPSKRTTGATKKTTANNSDSKESSSPFDSSISFQLFLIVGAMGAGYTLGKTTVINSPPSNLFPNESVTSFDVLKEYETVDKERENKQYDMFKRCILRILEGKGIDVDMKYGKNDKLFEDEFCNEEISKIMNDIDNIGDVFFGKDLKEWDGKDFVWYPETTEDVSNILKNADEFKIQCFTANSKLDSNGLVFQINFDKFKTDEESWTTDELKINTSIAIDDLNKRLSDKGLSNVFNSSLSPHDLFLMKCGIKLSNTDDRLISNKFSIDEISGVECVLPDGKIVDVKKNGDRYDSKVFDLLTKLQDNICIITHFFVEKKFFRDTDSFNNLVIMGSNNLTDLNKLINEIKQKYNDKKVSLIDNHGSESIYREYGNYKTFAVVKLNDSELLKLNKKFTEGVKTNNEFIESLRISDIGAPAGHDPKAEYFSNQIDSGSAAIIINKDITAVDGENSSTFYAVAPSQETLQVESEHNTISQDLIRRIKLSLDSNRILNRDAGVYVSSPKK